MRVNKKLDNASYVKKAPAAVVEKEKANENKSPISHSVVFNLLYADYLLFLIYSRSNTAPYYLQVGDLLNSLKLHLCC